MLDWELIEALLDWEFEDLDFGIPEDIPRDVIEALSQYAEEDYHEWLKNPRSFFNHGNPDWKLLQKR